MHKITGDDGSENLKKHHHKQVAGFREKTLNDFQKVTSSTTEASNIAKYLDMMAKSHPGQDAIIVTENLVKSSDFEQDSLSYEQLQADSEKIALSLIASGFRKGHRAVLMIPPSFELFTLTFALFKAGIVPIFIDPGMGLKNLKACLRDAAPHYFIGIAKAHIARILLGWQRGKLEKTIMVGSSRLNCDFSYADLKNKNNLDRSALPEISADDLAAILFTSGSTGLPKGVKYTHANFDAQIKALKNAFQIEPGEIDLCTFPLFALFAPALGMTAVIPEMDFTKPAEVEPTAIFRAIEHFKVNNVFGSPALLARLADSSMASQYELTSLCRVISAGAPVPGSTLKAIKARLPVHVAVYTPYGATEALPVAVCSSDFLLQDDIVKKTNSGHGVCVGRPVPSISVKIIKITDQVIGSLAAAPLCKAGEIGEIIVQGPQVTAGYFNRQLADRQSKVNDGSLFYHRMGDLGYFDEAGNLWFCGRKSHRIEKGDRSTVFTIPGESIFNSDDRIKRSAIVAVGRTTVLCVETKKPIKGPALTRLTEDLKQIAKQYEQTRTIEKILYHKSFPVDIRHNSKIFREKLAVWAEKELRL